MKRIACLIERNKNILVLVIIIILALINLQMFVDGRKRSPKQADFLMETQRMKENKKMDVNQTKKQLRREPEDGMDVSTYIYELLDSLCSNSSSQEGEYTFSCGAIKITEESLPKEITLRH